MGDMPSLSLQYFLNDYEFFGQTKKRTFETFLQVYRYVNFYHPAHFWSHQEQLMAERWVTFDKDCMTISLNNGPDSNLNNCLKGSVYQEFAIINSNIVYFLGSLGAFVEYYGCQQLACFLRCVLQICFTVS